jgi:hypothetical protein
MEKSAFESHLLAATESCLNFTRTLCWNKLSDNIEFVIQPDNLNEKADYLSDFEMFHFKQRKAELNKALSFDEVINRLWIARQVPVWVNLSVKRAKYGKTVIELLIDRRLRENDNDIYHQQEGYPPFHILVSTPPYRIDHSSQSVPQKFNVKWNSWPWKFRIVLSRLLFRIRTRNYRSLK